VFFVFKALRSSVVDLFIKQAVRKRVYSIILLSFEVKSSCDGYDSLKRTACERYSVCILLYILQISTHAETGLIFNKKSIDVKFILKNL
jgi:hypothetical protein